MNALNKMMLSFALVPLALACASSARRPEAEKELRVESSDPVLLTASGALELHVVDGHIVELVPGTEPGQSARTRLIKTLDDLRTAYAESAGKPLPDQGPGGVLQVNGWSGLQCVRDGLACGRQPEDLPQVMVIIRFQ